MRLRASVSSFGPILLAKVLDLNETQQSVLAMAFKYADDKQLPLINLADLRALLNHLNSDEGKSEMAEYGGVATATVGVIVRKIVELEQQEADAFFGSPEFEVEHFLRTADDGRGIVSVLELADMQDRPALFSTFMMWLLANLYESLPEVGDVDKPKLVFFFDEAHLLFRDANKTFMQQIELVARLIRSKGVGVFFVTHSPTDVPAEVLGQLGNRVQHALARVHAGRPRDGARHGRHVPDHRVLRPHRRADQARHRRGDRLDAGSQGQADADRADHDASADVADGPGRAGRLRRRRHRLGHRADLRDRHRSGVREGAAGRPHEAGDRGGEESMEGVEDPESPDERRMRPTRAPERGVDWGKVATEGGRVVRSGTFNTILRAVFGILTGGRRR